MICIIDYQMGNLRSVQKAFERVGHEAIISNRHDDIERADKLVSPGVGAFRDAISEIRKRDLVGPIKTAIDRARPFLGICLGLQMLFDVSYEDGEHQGLEILPGTVRKFEVAADYKVPHMGWNQIHIRKQSPILDGISDGAHFYFVHSYYVCPTNTDCVAAEADYPEPFCAMIWRDNLFATQFHPEKSQQDGLKLLKNFGDLN